MEPVGLGCCAVLFFCLLKFIMETGNSSNAKFYGSKKGTVIHFLTFSNLSIIRYVWEIGKSGYWSL